MGIGLLFWIWMLLGLVLGVFVYRPYPANFRPFSGYLFLWIAVCLIGWAVFGAAIHR